MRDPRPRRFALRAFVLFALSLVTGVATASPEAHILRIDPRASQQSGDPLITMVVEIVQSKRVSEATAPCAALTGSGQLDCMANALEKPQALYDPFPFPDKNAVFTVTVDDTDRPAKFV